MEQRMLIQLCGLACGTAYITATYDSSPAFTSPWRSAIVLYFTVGVALLLFDSQGRAAHRSRHGVPDASAAANHLHAPIFPTAPTTGSTYLGVPGDERIIVKPLSSPRRSPLHSRHGSGDPTSASASSPAATQLSRGLQWRSRATVALLVLSLCLRVLVVVAWLGTIECSRLSVGCLLPFVLALFESRDQPDLDLWLEKVDDRLDKPAHPRGRQWFNDARLAYLAAMLAFAVSGGLLLVINSSPASTYVCLPGRHGSQLALLYQSLGLLLDSTVFICAKELLSRRTASRQSVGGATTLGWASLSSSCLLLVAAIIVYCARPDLRPLMSTTQPSYVWGLIKLVLVAALTLLCALSLGPRLELHQCATIASFVAVLTTTALAMWATTPSFVSPWDRAQLTLLVVLTAAFLYAADCWCRPASVVNTNTSTRSAWRTRHLWYAIGAIIVCGRLLYITMRTTSMPFHPIEELVSDAGDRHVQWQMENRWEGGTLDEAVSRYHLRYQRPPPPNFDKWFKFATDRLSFTIDNFDNIYDDLLPFWSISPAELKEMTAEDISRQENGIGGISIRGHTAVVDPKVPQSHAWQLEAVVNMIGPFIQYLPDMDLAFNMDDESRVMVPYQMRRGHPAHDAALTTRTSGPASTKLVSTNRNTHVLAVSSPSYEWAPLPQPFKSMFDDYGSAHCPPHTPARRHAQWQLQALCTACMSPHSHPLGPFPTSHSLTTDICHQPDMAHLHGAYSAPSTFKPTHELRPVFSQSRAPGFMDIRYPNPWNYAGLVRYNPPKAHPDRPFAEKEDTLFWLGTTTEGFASADGRHAWQGMTRQRFVNAINFPSAQNVLLPLDTDGNGDATAWRYDHLPADQIQAMLSTDVSIDAPIARCMHTDCSDQIALFNRSAHPFFNGATNARTAISAAGIDFQAHWRYRYLFDMDGAGLSGRFLPFLHSRSLVIKTTSLFSEWWDGRVQEWWHYVPVDPRLTGLWSTLAFFMGVKPGTVRGGRVQWAGQHGLAEVIANNGKEWAGTVLREEDMEIYMFRLLLEWGRLVDDDRDTLGFEI